MNNASTFLKSASSENKKNFSEMIGRLREKRKKIYRALFQEIGDFICQG